MLTNLQTVWEQWVFGLWFGHVAWLQVQDFFRSRRLHKMDPFLAFPACACKTLGNYYVPYLTKPYFPFTLQEMNLHWFFILGDGAEDSIIIFPYSTILGLSTLFMAVCYHKEAFWLLWREKSIELTNEKAIKWRQREAYAIVPVVLLSMDHQYMCILCKVLRVLRTSHTGLSICMYTYTPTTLLNWSPYR